MKKLSICLTITLVCLSASSAADATVKKLYWTTWTGSAGVWRSNLDGSQQEHIISTPVQSLDGVAADLPRGKLYISTGYDLLRSNLDGSGLETIIAGTVSYSFYGVVVDSDAQKVYWSTWADGAGIRRADLDGSNVETIFVPDSGEYSYHIAIDQAAGKLYWSNSFDVYRSNLDGANRELLVNDLGTGLFAGMDLDIPNNKMYFTTWQGGGSGAIYRADMDGNNVQLVVGSTKTHDIALDTTTGKMYWPAWAGSPASVMRANMDGTQIETIGPLNGSGNAMSIVVPEPATLFVMACGAAGLLRKRRSKIRRGGRAWPALKNRSP